MTGLAELLSHFRQRVDRALDHWLPDAAVEPQRLHEAMRYMTLGEGKRLRPILVYAAGRANGVAESALDGLACAVELIHSYSLVHDDLPAMDNDDLRRGRPTCHRRTIVNLTERRTQGHIDVFTGGGSGALPISM